MSAVIPPELRPLARAFLSEMQKIEHPSSDQARLIGSLRKALGHVSNNDKRKAR